MKKYTIVRFCILCFIGLLILNASIIGATGINVMFLNSKQINASSDDLPTQEELFEGRTFEENYWNINVFNNSKWAAEDVENWTSWENNTWNLVWIKEGGFEMGMISFLNKTGYEDGKNVTYTSPARLWWHHFSIYGIELASAAMQCAWFGINDSDGNKQYDDGEEIYPFFYLGSNSPNMTDVVGIYSDPKAEVIPLSRSTNDNKIIYTWGYNYTNIIFYLPSINYSSETPTFDEGWDYTDPDTYINGSDLIGNQTYISYEYKLEIDTANSFLTFTQNYESGKIDTLMYHNDTSDEWIPQVDGDPYYMPDNWILCLGTGAFMIAGVEEDYGITDLQEGEINSTIHKTGLSEVNINVGRKNNTAFQFLYDQNPQYNIWNISDQYMGAKNVSYETVDVSDDYFVDFVGGVLHILGNFSRLVLSYAANQTHNFGISIPQEDIYESLDPAEGEFNAAFFIEAFPEYGVSGGGKFNHTTLFKAYFPSNLIPPLLLIGPPVAEEIPGFILETFIFSILIGIVVVLTLRKKILNINN
ncbi:MAG: hypothetical protein BAJALOKI1v1_360012 [Promethearchaeota archaeon]|nr:MAG: hypothetical protein BAJALOKI1v1_360012 [Candidatus Lokiarchaeota archaeon]